jgi:uncharacterized protein (TIGR02145 family)
MLALVMTGAASVNGQVLIGGTANDEPHGGAILDLASGGNNNLGMLLPNVTLSHDATEFVLVPEGTPGMETIKQTAAGMLVYNAAYDLRGPGVYVWDGSKWTPIVDPCPRTVKDVEGNEYFTGWFGEAGCWMTQNLRTTSGLEEGADRTGFDDETGLPTPAEKYYTYPGAGNAAVRKSNWHEVYGLLYNWYAATGRPSGINVDEAQTDYGPNHALYQGICPKGWHIPSDKEWTTLERVISESAAGVYSTGGPIIWNFPVAEGEEDKAGYRGSHGTKMKSTTPVTDTAPDPQGTSKAANAGGFDGLLVGVVQNGNPYVAFFGGKTVFWSSSSYLSITAWYRELNVDLVPAEVSRYNSYEWNLLSVRCKKTEN